jgi:hypothetical protein
MKRTSPSNSEMFENDSLSGGYPYNGGGNVVMPGGTGAPSTTPNPIGMGGTQPGLSALSKPTTQTPAQNGISGPNPLSPPQGLAAVGGAQGTPASPASGNGGGMGTAFGGMTNPTPQGVSGQPDPQPGGPIQSPVDLGQPIMQRPQPQTMAPPGGLQGTPPAQRSPGFGGIKPAMSY